MSPSDKTKGSGVQVHGSIHHFTRKAGRLLKCRRWAYVSQDSLLIFPDAYTSSHCYRILLNGADVTISYEDEDNPLIAITEPKTNNTYLIQPEKSYKFQKWLSAIHKASRSSSDSIITINNTMDATQASPLSVIGTATVPLDAPDFTVIPEYRNRQTTLPVQNQVHIIPPTPPNRNQSTEAPEVPKRIAMPWACKPGRSQKKSRENQWTPIQPALPSRSSRRVSSKQTDEPELPPPRPPRAGMPLKTVKEHPDMKDGDVVPTKSLDEVKNRYPVSGLAKRMSISASDLLGKSRDELVLLLLQLNREKANLQRWHDYFTQQIELIRKTKRDSSEARNDIEAIEVELTDVNGQLSLSEPLVTFLSNMLRMGDLYGGDDVLFASEYRQHLLPAHEIVPPKPSLTLAREVEAREVARTLNASKRKMSSQPKPTTRSSTMTDVSCTLANWIARSDHGDWDSGGLRAREPPADRNLRCLSSEVDLNYSQETASMRQRREQLESELADLEELCAPHSEIHKRLRETQRSLRTPDRVMLTNGNKIQGMIPHASGPSAALLRRLRSEQNTGNRRSGADSLWVRTRPDQEDDDYGLEWFELARPMDGSLCRETDTSGRTTPRRRNKSASARAQGITPIQDAVDTHTRAESIRTYHSIPDRLNLLTLEESNVQSPLTRQKSFEWEPLNRPLNTPRPVGDSVNKFSALQPEVFISPTHTGRYYRPNYNMRSGHRDAQRALDLVNEAGAQNRKVYPADSTSGFHYSSSDRLFREWSQPLMDSSERPLRRDSLRPTSDFIPNQRSIFGYSNERMDRTLEPDLLENGDIPRVVRPYSSNTNELRPNYSSPDLTRLPNDTEFGKLQGELSPADFGRRTTRNRSSNLGDRRQDIAKLVFAELNSADFSKPNQANENHNDHHCLRRTSERSPNFDGSHTIQLLNRNPWDTGHSGRNLDSTSSIDTESTTKDFNRERATSVKDLNSSIVEWLKFDSPPSPRKPVVNGDPSIRKADVLEVNQRSKNYLQSDKNSMDYWCLPGVAVADSHEQPERPIKPRMRRSTHDYLLTAESIESMFSPPEPMKIEERYMPSPPQNESSDTEIRRSKEARLHAIRELLLRQRISGDFDHRDPPPTPHASQTKERVSHSAHLISMQAKLARDAVASVFQQAESRMQANKKLNA